MEIPIVTLPLFPKLDAKLIELLKGLSPDEWQMATLAREWTVKDIAAHLLDGNLRTLSIFRDGYFGDPPGTINAYADLVGYLNRLNHDWVKAMKRISPGVLIEELEASGKKYTALLNELDPFAPSAFAVSWAGETQSLNWFHIAREYTEKWHHQQQIRHAVGKPGISIREFYFPVLDTFMRALPYTWRETIADENTTIKVSVAGDAGGEWAIVKKSDGWHLADASSSADATIAIDQDIAWKLFTKAIAPDAAKDEISFNGDVKLCVPILKMLAVMA